MRKRHASQYANFGSLLSTTQNGLVSNNRMEVSVETYGKTADVDGDRILHQPYVIQVAIFHTQ